MTKIRYDCEILRENLRETLIQFVNCRLINILENYYSIVENGEIWIKNGRIIDGKKIFYDEKCNADLQVDCCGLIIAPGFIDIQINGGFGTDFSSVAAEDFVEKVEEFSQSILRYGCTAYCPTFISSRPEIYHKVVPLIDRIKESGKGATVLGAHLEGPFIAKTKKGAHPEANICEDFGDDPVLTIKSVYGSLENVSIVTVAPELNGVEKAIEFLKRKNIVVSLGHTNAHLEDGLAGLHAGATALTHLFNAMRPLHHRDPGIIGLITMKHSSPLYFGIISDGIHCDEAILRIAHSVHPDGLILITDAIAAFGMGDGIHRLGDQKVRCKGMKATVDGTNTIAGSIASMDHCVRYFKKVTGCSLAEAIYCATARPARLLGIEKERGSLSFGCFADLILIDDDISVHATFVGAKLSYLAL